MWSKTVACKGIKTLVCREQRKKSSDVIFQPPHVEVSEVEGWDSNVVISWFLPCRVLLSMTLAESYRRLSLFVSCDCVFEMISLEVNNNKNKHGKIATPTARKSYCFVRGDLLTLK